MEMIYLSYCHSSVSYGIFCFHSYFSNNVAILQKMIVRIIMGVSSAQLCGELYKVLKILPL
jgi:hypothetical protein